MSGAGFVKADDDTFMLIDNMREMLSKFNPSEPHFLGRHCDLEQLLIAIDCVNVDLSFLLMCVVMEDVVPM